MTNEDALNQIGVLLQEILNESYPQCDSDMKEVSDLAIVINKKAYDAKVILERYRRDGFKN